MRTFVEKYTLGVLILGLVILIATGSFFSTKWWVIAGQIAGLAVVLSSRVMFRHQEFKVTADPGSGGLIRGGPYRFVRHPIYAGALLVVWASVLGNLSPLSVTVAVVITVFVVMRVSAEERLLRERYAEYEEYSRHTKRLIPFVY